MLPALTQLRYAFVSAGIPDLDCDMKLGHFGITFEEVSIPLAGTPEDEDTHQSFEDEDTHQSLAKTRKNAKKDEDTQKSPRKVDLRQRRKPGRRPGHPEAPGRIRQNIGGVVPPLAKG